MTNTMNHEIEDHLPQIRRVVSRIARDEGIVDDIAQECCVRIIEKEALWRQKDRLTQWINAVTRNVTINYLKRHWRQQRMKRLEEDIVEIPQERDFSLEDIRWVVCQFQHLTPTQKDVMHLKYFEGLKSVEIAGRLEISESRVSHHIASSLKTLRKQARAQGLLAALLPWNWFSQTATGVSKMKIAATLGAATVGATAALNFFLPDPATDLVAETANLKTTTLTAHLDVPLDDKTNLVWCSSLQMAWNDLKEVLEGAIRHDVKNPDAEILNASTINKEHVSDRALVAQAGFVRDGIVESLQAELHRKFKKGRDPVLDQLKTGPEDIIAYSYLYKDLPFQYVFEVKEGDPLRFGSTPVKSFGINQFDPGNNIHRDLRKQITICRYKSENDFVVRLQPASENDEIILACRPPKGTLSDMIRSVVKTSETPELGDYGRRMETDDVLLVPKFDFELSHNYDELAGPIQNGLSIEAALQTIRFKLDERGAILKSRAIVHVLSDGMPRRMIFNKPFLVVLREKGSQDPYFAAWVSTPEILVSDAPKRAAADGS